MAGRSQERKVDRYDYDATGRSRPRVATVPTVAGTNTVGQTLTGTNGTFSGTGTITITRFWSRNGVAISGATGATYVLVAGDSGKTIRFHNVGRSAYGEARSASMARTIA